jgi:hypothetical protein
MENEVRSCGNSGFLGRRCAKVLAAVEPLKLGLRDVIPAHCSAASAQGSVFEGYN